MIRQLRKSIQGPAGKVLIVLFCIPFALFGAEAFLFTVQGDSSMGEVNGEPLSRYEFSRLLDRLAERFGGYGQNEAIDKLVWESARRGLVDQELLVQTGHEVGLEIPDSVVDDLVRSAPEFQTSEGVYDPALFATMARDQGLTQDQLRNSLSRTMMLYRMQLALTQPAPAVSLDRLQRLWTHQRDLTYISLQQKNFIPASLADEQLQQYYDEHVDSFLTRAESDISLLELSSGELDRRAAEQVSDEKVEQAYQDHRRDAEARVQRRASHIMLDWEVDDDQAKQQALQQAQQLHDQLVAGADFAQLAREHSKDFSAEQGGDLGFSQGDVFPDAFEQVLLGLEPGAFSAPVELEDAVHIIRLTEVEAVEIEPFEQVKPSLVEQLRTAAREQLQQELIERMGELAYSSPSVEDMAGELQLQVQQLDGIYRGHSGDGPASLSEVQEAALSPDIIESGFLSEPISTGGNTLVLQVRAHRPARQQSFEEAREQVVERLGKQIASRALEEKAQLLEQALLAGENLQAAAKAAAIEEPARELSGIDRTSSLLDRQAVEALFALPADGIGQWKRVATDGTITWVQLLGARESDEDPLQGPGGKFFSQQVGQLQSSLQSNLLLEHLREHADIWLESREDILAQEAAVSTSPAQNPFSF